MEYEPRLVREGNLPVIIVSMLFGGGSLFVYKNLDSIMITAYRNLFDHGSCQG